MPPENPPMFFSKTEMRWPDTVFKISGVKTLTVLNVIFLNSHCIK